MPKRASESDSGRPSPSWGDKLIDFSLKYAEQKPFEKVTRRKADFILQELFVVNFVFRLFSRRRFSGWMAGTAISEKRCAIEAGSRRSRRRRSVSTAAPSQTQTTTTSTSPTTSWMRTTLTSATFSFRGRCAKSTHTCSLCHCTASTSTTCPRRSCSITSPNRSS